MDRYIEKDLLESFSVGFVPPYTGSVYQWASENIELPSAYAITGRFSIAPSPYLIQPMDDLLNPKVRMLNLISATQTGKSLVSELVIPYWIINDPGPVLRVHQTEEMATTFTETRLIPLLKKCPPVKEFLAFDRHSAKKKAVNLPHMSIKIGGANETLSHGLSIRYLCLDETHIWDLGLIEKFIARTTAFAGRRKIIVSSQPNQAGSELEKYYQFGQIYEWHWQCPQCKQAQPFVWNKKRDDNSYAGMNWDTILMPDGETTNIALSARTAWLECFHCRFQIHDNVANRRMLNDNGRYVCLKPDGDPEIHSYNWPAMVNMNLSFESFVIQYLNAKKMQRNTGLATDMITFVNQTLAKFYKAEPQLDMSKIMIGSYDPKAPLDKKEWLKVLSVDLQRRGSVKYYVVRGFHKSGNESRLLDHGICRTYEDIEAIRAKHDILPACVGVDSGDGESTTICYQESIKHGFLLKDNAGRPVDWVSWICFKGDQKIVYANHPDKILRFYSPMGKGDPAFPLESKYRGLYAKLTLWSNYSIKSVLANCRDNKVPGVKWLIDTHDQEYEYHLYSEGLVQVVDKRTGLNIQRWVQKTEDNHFFDCEAQALVLAMMAGYFTACEVNEEELKKAIPQPTTSG